MKKQRVDQVFAACHQLETQRPGAWTRTDVRILVGGSDRDLSTLINAWKSLRELSGQTPDTADTLLYELAQHCDRVFAEQRQAQQLHQAQYQNNLEEALQDFNQQTEALDNTVYTLHQQLDDQTAQMLLQTQTIETKKQKIQSYQEKITDLERERHELLWKANQQEQQSLAKDRQIEQQIQQHQKQIQLLQSQFQEDKAKLIGQSEKEQNRLMKLLAGDRDEHKKQLEKLTKKVTGLQNQISDYQLKQQDQKNQFDQLQQENQHLINSAKSKDQEIQAIKIQLRAKEAHAELKTQENLDQIVKKISRISKIVESID